MSEQHLISPLLDNLIVGEPFSSRSGVRCCPAIERETEDKYIVKIVSTPASASQMDAMLLSGAFTDHQSALNYFKELATSVEDEAAILEKLSHLEGFLPFTGVQTVDASDSAGYETYFLSPYRRTLERRLRKEQLTHLAALNLGLDICSALAVCRRSGYLYVSLKPENIFITDEGSYRIGDIGFVRMDSLQYASLPDRCRSQYTAPEIADAFSSLNTTIDIYALGLILYRIFNGGELPVMDDLQQLPSPEYADYEMSEIILKACALDPKDRWQDPVEFGQALVSYMQRNGAHDAPIIPAVTEDASDADSALMRDDTSVDEMIKAQQDNADEAPAAETKAEDDATGIPFDESPVYNEDPSGNLTFLSDNQEILPDEELAQIEYDEVSEEVSEILNQADKLISHEAPPPVIPPEPVDVPIPDPLPLDEPEFSEDPAKAEASKEEPAGDNEEEEISSENTSETDDSGTDDSQNDAQQVEQSVKTKKHHWLRNTLLVLLALAMLVGGIFFYKDYYLQKVDGLRLQGSEGTLFVYVDSGLDDEQLTVVCSDIYGNQLTEEVINGKAVFENLAPNSAYTVKVSMLGFHRLVGHTTDAYTTPSRTQIVQFTAVAGSDDGSVILGFTIEGQDTDLWKVTYSTAGEPTKTLEFSGHIATINGLTVGNDYKFKLEPVEKIYITGTDEISFTACALVRAEDLRVTGCINGTLSVAWSAPEATAVSSWTVHCYNDSGYDKTIVTEHTNAEFTDIVDTDSYTVEVTASGMSVSQRVYVDSNSITVLNFKAEETDANFLTITWEQPAQSVQESYVLQYSVDGSSANEIACSENSAVISPRVPGSTYSFTLKTSDGRTVLGGSEKYKTATAPKFEGYGVSYNNLDFMMCRTPSYSDWNRYYLDDSDYTTSFSVDGRASFLVRIRSEYDTSWDEITTLYVIRDAVGNIVSTDAESSSWTYMWYRNYGEFDIPSMPGIPGDYSITVYFNGALAGQTDFTVYE